MVKSHERAHPPALQHAFSRKGKSMHKLWLACAGAASLAFAGSANAAITVNGSSMSVTGPNTTGNTTAIGYSTTVAASPFQEWLTFTNTMLASYTVTLTTSSAPVDFTSALLCSGASVCSSSPFSLTKSFDNGTSEFWNFGPAALDSGQYTLVINGDVAANQSGSLGGSVTVSAVPEPATWLMMLLGMAGVGFVVSRRRRKTSELLQLA